METRLKRIDLQTYNKVEENSKIQLMERKNRWSRNIINRKAKLSLIEPFQLDTIVKKYI
jgi:hypothetical protein